MNIQNIKNDTPRYKALEYPEVRIGSIFQYGDGEIYIIVDITPYYKDRLSPYTYKVYNVDTQTFNIFNNLSVYDHILVY